jgi:cell wall-associated NlpC family hydrolase
MKHQVTSPVADVYGVPDASAFRGKFESQLVLGEIFNVIEEKDGWCKGACAHDDYPGWVEKRHLTKDVKTPTHVITAVRTHAYRDETMKSPVLDTLSFGSLIFVSAEHQEYAQINNGAWVYLKHIAPLHAFEKDHVATALKFLEVPYYWGGRSGFGTDCSGLVQMSLARAGVNVLRDTEMQEGKFGKRVDTPKSGDIVFFPGHVGIMVDDRNIIHANAFHMKTIIEPLKLVAERSNGITAIQRL